MIVKINYNKVTNNYNKVTISVKMELQLTFFIGSVLHLVGAIPEVTDQGISAVARGVVDAGLDVIATTLGKSSGIHSEVCSGLTEHTFGTENNTTAITSKDYKDHEHNLVAEEVILLMTSQGTLQELMFEK